MNIKHILYVCVYLQLCEVSTAGLSHWNVQVLGEMGLYPLQPQSERAQITQKSCADRGHDLLLHRRFLFHLLLYNLDFLLPQILLLCTLREKHRCS